MRWGDGVSVEEPGDVRRWVSSHYTSKTSRGARRDELVGQALCDRRRLCGGEVKHQHHHKHPHPHHPYLSLSYREHSQCSDQQISKRQTDPMSCSENMDNFTALYILNLRFTFGTNEMHSILCDYSKWTVICNL